MNATHNESLEEKALKNFENGFSCSQSVLAVFCEKYNLDRLTALKLADTFGGGMGGMALTCGAVTGAIMVLGLEYGRILADDSESKEKTHEVVQEFVRQFKEENRSITCKELMGCDISNEVGLQYARDNNLFKLECSKFVSDAVTILKKMMIIS